MAESYWFWAFWALVIGILLIQVVIFIRRWRDYRLHPYEFRTRPVKKQAVQLLDIDKEDGIFLGARGRKSHETPDWFEMAFNRGDIIVGKKDNEPVLYVKTLEGEHVIRIRMWIIRGLKGEIYGCQEDIFNQTYE